MSRTAILKEHPCPSCGASVTSARISKRCDSCPREGKYARQRVYDRLESTKERARNQQRLARQKLLDAYGSRCACCGEDEERFLTFEHINGCPDEHKTELGTRVSNRTLYNLVKAEDFPSTYEVLCWNCNLGRALNGGICPHEGLV